MYWLLEMPSNLTEPFFEYIFKDLAFWCKFHRILFLSANWQWVSNSSGASSAASHCLGQRWTNLPTVCASVGSNGFKILSFSLQFRYHDLVLNTYNGCVHGCELLCIVSSMLVISCIHSADRSIKLSGSHRTRTQPSEVRWAARSSGHWVVASMFA